MITGEATRLGCAAADVVGLGVVGILWALVVVAFVIWVRLVVNGKGAE